MLISRKRQGYCNLPDLLLDNLTLERAECLGGILTSNLSWSRKLLALLYFWFLQTCQTISTTTVLSFPGKTPPRVWSDVWDPHLQRDIQLIQNMQKFRLTICSKQWDLGYDKLLSNFTVPNLESRQIHHKLCTIFKIVHNLISFPSSVFVPHPSRCQSNVYLHRFSHIKNS